MSTTVMATFTADEETREIFFTGKDFISCFYKIEQMRKHLLQDYSNVIYTLNK